MAYKPARVFAIDSVDQRLEMAEGYGAIPINITRQNATVTLQDACEAGGVDVLLECVGGSKVLVPTFDMVRFGGRIAVIGVHSEPEALLPLQMMFVKAIDLKFCGTANVVGHWDESLKLIEDHTIDPESIISHTLPLDEALRGYELFASHEAMKVVLKP
ncbi:MAG: zinc-binding dehydrogenase, partial [Candidatus Dormibacteria bacterium]